MGLFNWGSKSKIISDDDKITKIIIAQKKNLSKELRITLDDNQIARISKLIYNSVFHRTKRKYHHKECAEEFREILEKNIGRNEDIIVRWLKPKRRTTEKLFAKNYLNLQKKAVEL